MGLALAAFAGLVFVGVRAGLARHLIDRPRRALMAWCTRPALREAIVLLRDVGCPRVRVIVAGRARGDGRRSGWAVVARRAILTLLLLLLVLVLSRRAQFAGRDVGWRQDARYHLVVSVSRRDAARCAWRRIRGSDQARVARLAEMALVQAREARPVAEAARLARGARRGSLGAIGAVHARLALRLAFILLERAGGALFAACLLGLIVEAAWLALGLVGTSDRARVPSVARLASVLAGLARLRVVEARLAPSLRVRALQTVRALRALHALVLVRMRRAG